MALNVAQLMTVPGGTGAITNYPGAVKNGLGINISSVDGSVNLIPPTGTTIGGVRAGSGVAIDPATGVISTTGGIGSITAGTGILVSGTTNVTISQRPATASVIGGVRPGTGLSVSTDGTLSLSGGGAYLPLSGGTLTGRLQIPVGSLADASLGFTGSSTGTGLFSPRADVIGITVGNSNSGVWINEVGQLLAGRPEDIPLNYAIGGTTYQVWSDRDAPTGQKSAGVGLFFFGEDDQYMPRVRMCRGWGTIENIQDFDQGQIGRVVFAEGFANNPIGIERAQMSAYQPNLQTSGEEAARLVLWNSPALSNAMIERFFVGGNGTFSPWLNNSYDLGNGNLRFRQLFLNTSPIVGQPDYFSVSELQSELGLEYIQSLQPVSYVPQVEYYQTSRGWIEEPSESNWSGIPAETVVTPVPGTTTHWGFVPGNIVTLNESMGLQGNLGVAGIDPDSDEPFIRNEELIAPVVLAIQQLAGQLEALQTAFDNYVATHP